MTEETIGRLLNWTGFVLLRHDLSLREKPEANFDPKRSSTFYSLYMHLAPLQGQAIDRDPYFKSIPWFRELMRRRYGTFTKLVDEAQEPAGTTYWAKEPVPDQLNPGAPFAVYDRKEPVVPLDDAGRVRWFFKHGSVDFAEVIQGLDDGKLVTFQEPFVTVASGEAIGFISPAVVAEKSGQQAARKFRYEKASGESATATLSSGFLHWEVFAPLKDGKSDLQSVLALVRDAIAELRPVFDAANAATETTEDNFLEFDEMKSKLMPLLEMSERRAIDDALMQLQEIEKERDTTSMSVGNTVFRLFADGMGFAAKTEADAHGDFEKGPFTYPFTLQLEEDHLVSARRLASGGPYVVEIEYFSRAAGGKLLGKQTLAIDKEMFDSRESDDPLIHGHVCLTLSLRVPAEADYFCLVTPDDGELVLSPPARESTDDGIELLKQLAVSRWRGTRFSHLSEWSPSAIKKLVAKLKEKKLLPADFDPNAMAPMAWWQENGMAASRARVKNALWLRDAALDQPLLRAPSEKSVSPDNRGEKSLFGTGAQQLDPDAKIDNLHPVTFTWLLNILQQRGLAEVKPAKRAVFHHEDPEPQAAGWVLDQGFPVPAVGDPVHVLVIDDDFGYDPSVAINVKASSGPKELVLAQKEPYGLNGVFHRVLVADFWGKWRLSVEGKQAPKTVGLAELELPEPKLKDTPHPPRRHGRAFIWNIPVAAGAPVPSLLNGFVGIEVSKDGVSWHEPKVDGKHLCVAATAYGPPKQPELKLNVRDFEVRDDVIVGLAAGAKSSAMVSKGLSYASYVKAATEFRVTCSLLQALHDVGCQDGEVLSIDRDGASCVLRAGAWARMVKLADCCLDSSDFASVSLADGGAPLTKADLVDPKGPPSATKKALRERGFRVTVRKPLKKAEHCTALLVDGLRLSPDREVVVGLRDKETQLTALLTPAAFAHKTAVHVGAPLAQGLEMLHAAAKRPVVPSSLSWEGDSCWLADASLLEAASSVAAFTQVAVVEVGKQKRLYLSAAPARCVTVTFSPDVVLAALRQQLEANGAFAHESDAMHFRYYFCAVNGCRVMRGGDFIHEDLVRAEQESFRLPSRHAPHAVVARCTVPSGSLRKLGFGKVHGRLVEKELRLEARLEGNSAAWAGATVELRAKGMKSVRVKVLDGEGVVRGALPLPSGDRLSVDLEVVDGTEELLLAALTATASFPTAPKLIPDSATQHLGARAIDDYVVVWCATEGVEAPRATGAAVPFTAGGTKALGQIGTPQPRSGKARELVLEVAVKPPGQAERLPPQVEYYVPVAGGGAGYVTQDGWFAARIRRSQLDPQKTYSLSLKGKDALRGKRPSPLSGEIDPATRGADPARDGPLSDLRLLEDAARLNGYDTRQCITALRKIWYNDDARPAKTVYGVIIGGGAWSILIPGASATPIPPQWRPQGSLAGVFETARRTPVRTLEGGRVDLGHLFAGLDAGNNPTDIRLGGGVVKMRSNKEAATFLGDLGSVVAEYIHASKASMYDMANVKDEALLASVYDNYASEFDMNGNADAYALRLVSGKSVCDSLEAYYQAGAGVSHRYAKLKEQVKSDQLRDEVFNAAVSYAAGRRWIIDVALVMKDAGPGLAAPTLWELYWNIAGWVCDLFLARLNVLAAEG